jgi:hypothetical protein
MRRDCQNCQDWVSHPVTRKPRAPGAPVIAKIEEESFLAALVLAPQARVLI